MNKKTPFFLVTGFLGSGKTTFLKRLLETYAQNKKIAIIQNEFAPASIDGVDLKSTGEPFKIMEVTKGSVFCVCLLSNFISSITKFIKEQQPDVIFLETSGLADPIAIIEILQSPSLQETIQLSYVWCIVDAVNFHKITAVNTRVNHQLRIADFIILNKCDLLEENTRDIRETIQKHNPFAAIVEAKYCDIAINEIFEHQITPVAIQRADENKAFQPAGRPDIGIAVLKTNKLLHNDHIKAFLNETVNNTVRVKGYMRLQNNKCIAVQSIFGKTETKAIANYYGPTELIFIGNDVNISKINKAFKRIEHAQKLHNY